MYELVFNVMFFVKEQNKNATQLHMFCVTMLGEKMLGGCLAFYTLILGANTHGSLEVFLCNITRSKNACRPLDVSA